MDIETKTKSFLLAASSLYKDDLPHLSRHVNLDWELLQDMGVKNRCKTHCPECYNLFETGVNCIVRRRRAGELKRMQLSNLKLKSVDGCENVVLGKRAHSYWTILCRTCRVLFVDSSVNNRSARKRRKLLAKRRNYLGLSKKAKRTLSRRKRATNAKLERTKKKLTSKRSALADQIKGKSLKDFLIDCDLKLDS